MKRFICLILVIALLLLPASVSAASDIWFIAVDDTIPLTLTGGQVPFYSGGSLYVPCSAFDSEVLSVFYKYDSSSSILSVYNNNNRLIFELDTGTVLLKDGTEKDIAALSKNGTIFVPVYFVASSFSISCTELEGSGGYPIIRLTTGNEIYDNDKFVTQSKNLVDARVSQYLSSVQSQEPTPTPSPSPSATVPPTVSPRPSVPPAADDPEDEPVESPAPEVITGVDCTLFIDGSAYTELQSVLGDAPAVFTFTPDSLVNADETVRAIITDGYDIALVLDLSDAESALGSLDSCNQSLRRMAMYKSMMVLPASDTIDDEALQQLTSIGCQVWANVITADTSLDLTAYEASVAVYCPSITSGELDYFIKAAARIGSEFIEINYTSTPFDAPVIKQK